MSSKMITAWGETKTAKEWIQDSRVKCKQTTLILERIRLGDSPEEALSKPHKADLSPTSEVVERVKLLYATKTCKEIAEILNIPYNTVRCIRATHNLTKPKKFYKGKTYGRLTVVEEPVIKQHGKQNQAMALFKCSCGNPNILELPLAQVKYGNTQSCGCLLKENGFKASQNNVSHGMSGKRIYIIWFSMKQRCGNQNDKNYVNYGKKGVTVCEAWQTFPAFLEWAMQNGYDDKKQIDRIDYNGNYCPENCRWVNIIEQANNRSNNLLIEYQGKTDTLANWVRSDACVVKDYDVVQERIWKLKWSIERAFTTPHKKELMAEGNFKLNVKKGETYGNKRYWTDEETEFLINNFEKMTCQQIGHRLNRPTRSVQHKYSKLGLQREEFHVGDVIGKLTVLEKFLRQVGKQKKTFLTCKCECGREWTGTMTILKSGARALDCGCGLSEQ